MSEWRPLLKVIKFTALVKYHYTINSTHYTRRTEHLDHLDPNLPTRYAVQNLHTYCSTDPTQETCMWYLWITQIMRLPSRQHDELDHTDEECFCPARSAS